MKKVFAIFAIAALVACGGASTEATTDSTAVTVDSTAVVSTVVAAESALTSVEAPPHAANAAIAKIANTFFIFKVLSLV